MGNKDNQFIVFVIAVAAFVGAAIFFTGCSANSKRLTNYQIGYEKGFSECDQECLTLQNKIGKRIQALQKELAIKNTILRNFNQVDKDGNLYVNPTQEPEKTPDGEEDWMK